MSVYRTIGPLVKESSIHYTTYESSGPYGFGEEDFYVFSNCKSKGAFDPPGWGHF